MACLRLFLAWAPVAVLADLEAAGQLLRGRRLWSEPRVQLVNEKSRLYLTAEVDGRDWKAKGASECSSDRCNWFKLSVRKWDTVEDKQIAEATVIKTDWFPQSVLGENCQFFGGVFDSGKSYKESHYWEIVRLKMDVDMDDNVADNYKSSTFAFALYESRDDATPKFLAMKTDGEVFLKPLNPTHVHDDLEVQWKTSRIGTAPTPSEAWTIALGVPATVVATALTGGLGGYWTVIAIGAHLTVEATATAIGLAIAGGSKALFDQILPFLDAEANALFAK